MGPRSQCAARGAGDTRASRRRRFRAGRGRPIRAAVCRIVELQVRGRGAAPSAVRFELRRAVVDAHGSRCSISPQLSKTGAASMSNLHPFDIVFIALYFLILFGIAWWAAVREKNVSSDYFLASRDVAWFAVGASLFASNIGSEHLVGLAGTGAGSGLAVGHFEWLACLILLLLGWLFVPYYLKSGVYTMPEFLEKRYNSAARTYFTWVSVIGYVLTKISVTLYAGGVVIRAVTGWNFYTAAIVLIVVTGLYTVFGGLRAVVYTEVLQAIVLILGSLTLMAIGLSRVGGFSGLQAQVPAGFFSMWKPSNHPDFPWTGIVFGAPILGVWYWCTDQHIVQRVLAAKNVSEARRGTIFAGYLKVLPVFIFVLPGMVAAALYADVRTGAADSAYPALVTRLLPAGFKGLVERRGEPRGGAGTVRELL